MSLIKVLSYEIDFKKIEKNIFNISLGDYILKLKKNKIKQKKTNSSLCLQKKRLYLNHLRLK